MLTTPRRVLLLVAVLLVAAAGCGWTTFGYGPGRTGYNRTETAVGIDNVASLRELWASPTGVVLGSSSVAVSNGVVYMGGTDGNLYAFAARGGHGCSGTPNTCTPLWISPTGGNVSATPTVANGVVYVGSDDRHLYAFDARGVEGCSGAPKTCAPLWKASTGGYGGASPAVVNGVAYVGTDDGKLYAFDAAGVTNCSLTGSGKNCEPLWSATTGAPSQVSTPALDKGVVYVTRGARLYAFDAAGQVGCSSSSRTCVPLWIGSCTQLPGCVLRAPSVSDGVVYVGSSDGDFLGGGSLYAFDAHGERECSSSPGAAKTCAPLWRTGTGEIFGPGSPAVANGLIYVTNLSNEPFGLFGRLQAYDMAGERVWTSTEIHGSTTSPAVANGLVYVGSTQESDLDPNLYAFDAAGVSQCSGDICSPLWSTTIELRWASSSPIVANGVVYAGASALHAYALP